MAKKRSKRASKRSAKPPAPAPPVMSAQQLHQVTQWIVKGSTEHDVLDAIASHFPEHAGRGDSLVVAAMERLMQNAQPNPELVFAWCFEATREIYRLALDTGELSIALRAIKQLHDLGGGDV